MKRKKTNSRCSTVATAILFCWTVNVCAQDNGSPYFSKSELPNLVKCLPAPPDTIGEEFAHDIMRYFWGKKQRLDPLRADMAKRDAARSFEALFEEFNIPFGLEISIDGTPETWQLLVNSLTTTDLMRKDTNDFYMRKRPFARFNEHMLTEYEEEELRDDGAYLSDHTARGWLTALLLAEINPAAADTLFARGWMYGESRVIVGAHWQSDVDASRLAASIGYSRLQTSPAFRQQMEKAQDEFKRLAKEQSSIRTLTTEPKTNQKAYTVAGTPAQKTSQGIIIQDNRKILR